MEIALYRGTSLVSVLIRFLTRSHYSHAAFLIDEAAKAEATAQAGIKPFSKLHFFAVGCCIEAWEGGVKNSTSLSALHTPGTKVDVFSLVRPLSQDAEALMLRTLDSQIGDPYSYWNVVRFLTKRPGKDDGSWFCSELVFHNFSEVGISLLDRTKDWEVPPDWIARSPLLQFDKTISTK